MLTISVPQLSQVWKQKLIREKTHTNSSVPTPIAHKTQHTTHKTKHTKMIFSTAFSIVHDIISSMQRSKRGINKKKSIRNERIFRPAHSDWRLHDNGQEFFLVYRSIIQLHPNDVDHPFFDEDRLNKPFMAEATLWRDGSIRFDDIPEAEFVFVDIPPVNINVLNLNIEMVSIN